MRPQRLIDSLYLQVLAGIALGVLFGLIARWDGALDIAGVRRMLDHDSSGTETADVAEDRGTATRLAAPAPGEFSTWAPKAK